MTIHGIQLIRASLLASAMLLPAAAWAQESQSPPAGPNAPATGPQTADESDIVVTGTSVARAAFDTPLAVETLDEGTLVRTQAAGNADILNTIPTIKADGGGGEVAANVFVRGLPSGGQYQFTPLEYDGIPVLSTFGLNSSAFDVYYRNDLGIERLEFVRGGVSNLFGPGSVAGLINFISKTGTSEFGGVAQLEVAERDRYKGDIALSGPLGEHTFFALSGYYRYDEGTIKTNLKTKGYQLRGNLRQEFSDGSGSVTLYGQWIDDRVQFFLPIPLDGTTRKRIPGNDGKLVNSVQNDFDPTALSFNLPGGGRFVSDINDGVKTRGGQIALAFEKKFGDDWGINGRVKYAQYKHRFGLWSDGDGLINVPETQASFLQNRQSGTPGSVFPELKGLTTANARFTFADGSVVPANYLLFANRFTDRNRPMHDTTAELNLTKTLQTGSLEHHFTLGGFYADAAAKDIDLTTTYLAEFNNQPRLVNLVVTNPTTGAQTIISRNGLLRGGISYANNRHEVERVAGYFADQIEADRFSFDIGGRVEHLSGDISREIAANSVTDTTAGLSTAIKTVNYGTGNFLTAKVHTTEWAAAAGALFKVTPTLNIYLNGSRGFFFPEIRAVTFSPQGKAASYSAEIIKQIEGGVKFNNGRFQGSLAGFYTKLDNRRQVLFVNDGQGGFTEAVNLVATRSYGLEATANLEVVRNLHVQGNLTLQNAKYTQFQSLVNNVPTPNPAIIGNKLERQPSFLYNAGLYYDDGALDASIFTNYTGDNFVASNNAIELNGFNIVNLDAGYKIKVGGRNTVRVGINIFNLFDEDAVTEGSPRQDNNQTAGGQYFVGRPVLPRRITGRVTFSF